MSRHTLFEPEPVGIGDPLTVTDRMMEAEEDARNRRWNAMSASEQAAEGQRLSTIVRSQV